MGGLDTTSLPIRIILTMRIVIVLCVCVHLVSSCFPAPSEETTAAPATTTAADTTVGTGTTADPCANCDCSATTTAEATTTTTASGSRLKKREAAEENTYEEQIKTLMVKLEEAEARADAAESSLLKLQKN